LSIYTKTRDKKNHIQVYLPGYEKLLSMNSCIEQMNRL
jgi:hypothetical protein